MGYQQRLGSTHAWRLLRGRALKELPLVCSACGRDLDPSAPRCTPTAAELDHIISAAAGGPDSLENVQWMCHPCNRRKSDKRTPDDPRAQQGKGDWRSQRDIHGLLIRDPNVVCRVHPVILASCPHSGSLRKPDRP